MIGPPDRPACFQLVGEVAFPLPTPPLLPPPVPGLGAAEEAEGAALGVLGGGVVTTVPVGGAVCGGAAGEEDAVGGGTGAFGRGKAPGA